MQEMQFACQCAGCVVLPPIVALFACSPRTRRKHSATVSLRGECSDTNFGALGRYYLRVCYYAANHYYELCDQAAYDDDDFTASSMCCGCGGGSTSSYASGTPTRTGTRLGQAAAMHRCLPLSASYNSILDHKSTECVMKYRSVRTPTVMDAQSSMR